MLSNKNFSAKKTINDPKAALSLSLSVISLVLFAVLTRWLPHPANVTGLLAVSIFSGAGLSRVFLKQKPFWQTILSVVTPLLALLISDLVLGSHETLAYVYSSIILISLFSQILSQSSVWQKNSSTKSVFKWLRLPSLAVASSLFFFVVTNFGVWFEMSIYPKTASGLLMCYVAALPFLTQQILGDLFFTGVVFFAANYLSQDVLNAAPEKSEC